VEAPLQRPIRLLRITLGALFIALGMLLALSLHPRQVPRGLRHVAAGVVGGVAAGVRDVAAGVVGAFAASWDDARFLDRVTLGARLVGLVLIAVGVGLIGLRRFPKLFHGVRELGVLVVGLLFLPLFQKLFEFVVALAVLVVGLLLLWDARQARPVAAAFSRVGGPTRVETAVEASRFWRTPPRHVVTTSATAPPEEMLGAARCAMLLDAPLLFTSLDRNRQQLVKGRIDDLQANTGFSDPPRPKDFVVPVDGQRAVTECPYSQEQVNGPSYADRLSTLELSGRQLDLPVMAQETLAPVVVFAVAKAPRELPDVAVGLALAAHMARENGQVSLIAVPRYLPADPELEAALRERRELVTGGVVLGQTEILPEDTRALLRQVLTSTDRSGFLGELKTALGSFQTFIIALLTLLAARAAVRAAPQFVDQLVAQRVEGRTIVAQAKDQTRERTRWLGGSRPQPQPPPEAAAKAGPEPSIVPFNRQVTVWLRSGWRVTGISDSADVPSTALRLNDATFAREGDESERTAERVVVWVNDIELISVGRGGTPPSPEPKPSEPEQATEESKPPESAQSKPPESPQSHTSDDST
jgi:hypothetical protein